MGGISPEKQKRLLSQNPQIVVATPGRLWEWITLGNEHLSDVSKLRFLVIDEADRMMDEHNFKELKSVLHYINFFGKVTESKVESKHKIKQADIPMISENDFLNEKDDEMNSVKNEQEDDSDSFTGEIFEKNSVDEREIEELQSMKETTRPRKKNVIKRSFEEKLKFFGLTNEQYASLNFKEKAKILAKVDKLTRFEWRKENKAPVSNLRDVTGIKRQTLLFSATMNLVETGRFQARKDGKTHVAKKKEKSRLGLSFWFVYFN